MAKRLISVRLSDATLRRIRFCAMHLKLSNTRIIENAVELYFHEAKCDFDLYKL